MITLSTPIEDVNILKYSHNHIFNLGIIFDTHYSSASASVEDLGQSKSKKKIVIRAFKQEWKVGRPWLVYEKGLMFCSICREGKLITAKGSEKTNAFIARKKHLTWCI